MADRVGQRFGDYSLLRFLGNGTFGDVYLGQHLYEKTQVAVKVFKAQLTPDKMKDFVNEVRIIRLKHPNIVELLDFGIGENDIPYLVMAYAPNGTLLRRHPRGTHLPLATVIPYIKQIAAALQYAHDQRLIHRDVKPENMLFGVRNELLLSDFGIAVVAHGTHSQRTEDAIGTALYMAPEQWQGKPLPATDQYALGIIIYEWLCGESPFRGGMQQLMYQHFNDPPPPLHSKVPTISPKVERVVLTALAKDPKDRFATMKAFATALEQASQLKPAENIPARRSSQPNNARAIPSSSQQPGKLATAQSESLISTEFITPASHTAPPTELALPSQPPAVVPGRLTPLEPAKAKRGISRRKVIVGLGLTGLAVATWWVLSPHPPYTCGGHSSYVYAVAWSRDGRRIASGSEDHTVQVWQAE